MKLIFLNYLQQMAVLFHGLILDSLFKLFLSTHSMVLINFTLTANIINLLFDEKHAFVNV